MKQYLRFAICYLVVAVIVVVLTRDHPEMILSKILQSSNIFVSIFLRNAWLFVIGVPVLIYVVGIETLKHRIAPILETLVALILMHASFSLMKTSMPYISGFWADPVLAQIDRALHFGRDPYELAFAVVDRLPALPGWSAEVYILAWTPFAFALPIIIAATDDDWQRSKRFLILHTVAWIFIGNILALAGMSAGPVYFDRLLETERFAGLTQMLAGSGIAEGSIGRIQEGLWKVYVDYGQAIGSGISAFPSVHVATATVAALYLYERCRWLAPVSVAYVGAIQFYSVLTGYHYALDGYVSIIVVTALWVALRRPRAVQIGAQDEALLPAE